MPTGQSERWDEIEVLPSKILQCCTPSKHHAHASQTSLGTMKQDQYPGRNLMPKYSRYEEDSTVVLPSHSLIRLSYSGVTNSNVNVQMKLRFWLGHINFVQNSGSGTHMSGVWHTCSSGIQVQSTRLSDESLVMIHGHLGLGCCFLNVKLDMRPTCDHGSSGMPNQLRNMCIV
ncbi:hypothetical protein CC80DRAFT_21582 [Byssothecium circinans]|uniref:Uncharacterized protein n=1 Tax=Byssothecium circinans TaxID=147558 RepID=A0A6A5UCN5_9PLEO|nr:hypothetical protein CC80DRAFT_21582 [Byssothecium circinans]